MPSAKTYAARKAAGVCPCCQGVPTPGLIYCPACRQQMADYYAARAEATQVPGNAVLCCGRWHPIHQLPLRVICCGRVYFQETP